MKAFYKNEEEIMLFLDRLGLLRCPHCDMVGGLRRHGYTYHWTSPTERTVRLWRIQCKARHKGCGRTFSLRLASLIPLCCFSALDLMAFLLELKQGRSIKAA